MSVDIGRVFSSSWEMIKERWLLLLGMWLVFFVINILYSFVGGAVMGGSVLALGAAASTGMDDPEVLLGSLGIGAILVSFVFYLGTIVIILGQQCAMAFLATPLLRPQFSDAIKIGLKGGVTFLVMSILLVIAMFIFAIVYGIIGFALSLLGSVGAFLASLLLLPAMIYIALRFSVIVPVVAVDGTFNPINALKRTWTMTGGKVLPILGVYVVNMVIALVLLGIPFFLVFGSILWAESTDGAGLAMMGSMIAGFLLLIPMFLIYSVIAIVISTCLHAQLTDKQTDEVAATFG